MAILNRVGHRNKILELRTSWLEISTSLSNKYFSSLIYKSVIPEMKSEFKNFDRTRSDFFQSFLVRRTADYEKKLQVTYKSTT